MRGSLAGAPQRGGGSSGPRHESWDPWPCRLRSLGDALLRSGRWGLLLALEAIADLVTEISLARDDASLGLALSDWRQRQLRFLRPMVAKERQVQRKRHRRAALVWLAAIDNQAPDSRETAGATVGDEAGGRQGVQEHISPSTGGKTTLIALVS